jgi:putative ABC transport system permease protein
MKQERQIHLPFTEAFKIALRSLKIRFWRAAITTLGILLAIAFLSSILSSSAISVKLGLVSDEMPAQKIWIVIMSLLVCVVGITNAMLMAVTERYKEIGTMKCLGALNGFVIELFLLESSLQGLIGSLIGTVAGMLLTILMLVGKQGVKIFTTMEFFKTVSFGDMGWVIVFCVGMGVILSVIGAIYPAYRAAKMVPADAMRTEM